MGISAVLPIHNEASVLDAIFECVDRQSRKADEVIVVLDACSDRSEQIARSHGAKIVRVDLHNMALAVEAGVAVAVEETVIVFDGNTLVPNNYVELLSETQQRTRADVVEWHGGMMLFPRATLDRFGRLSPMYLWTLDFFLRVRELGGTVVRLNGPHVRLRRSPLKRNVHYGLDYAALSERHHLAPFFRIGTKSGIIPDLVATVGTFVGHARRRQLGRAVLALPEAIRATTRSFATGERSDPPSVG